MRLFEALDILNVQDAENKSQQVSICPDLVSVNKNGDNGTVKMGVPGSLAQQLALGEGNLCAILVVIDMDAYSKINK